MGMREKLIDLLMDLPITRLTYEEMEKYSGDVADYLLANGVTIPVRCKDCKYRILDLFGGHCCRLHKGLAMVTDESFCSYGERKDYGKPI